MTPSDVAALTLSILAGLAALVASLAALLQAYRISREVGQVRRDVNGRLDQLLQEREERVRMAYQLDAQQRHSGLLPPLPTVGRGDPVIRQIRPEEPKGE